MPHQVMAAVGFNSQQLPREPLTRARVRPALVQLVMDAIQVLMGDSTPTWAEAKRLLGDPQLIERLRSYDKDSIPERMLKVLHRYTKKDEFKPEVVAKVSRACCSLCMAAG